MIPLSDRERFCCAVAQSPTLRGDAIVVLTGDGVARLPTAERLLGERAAPAILVSGGRAAPPYSLTAHELAAVLIERGVDPAMILLENDSQHTRKQAVNVVQMACKRDWSTLLLVPSSYHQYRAFLTFLQAVIEVRRQETLHLVNVPAPAPWFRRPDGLQASRLDLLGEEFEKIEAYQSCGHVASFQDGLEYLKWWSTESEGLK